MFAGWLGSRICMSTIELDHDRCVGSGLCAAIAPTLFKVSADAGSTTVLQPSVTGVFVDDAVNAEVCCPVAAIRVVHQAEPPGGHLRPPIIDGPRLDADRGGV